MTSLPAVAALVAAALAVRCALGGGPARLMWSVALLQFAVASGLLALGSPWSPARFRAYYLFGAVLNTVWLGLGTVWLLAPRPAAFAATALVIVLSVWAALTVATTPLLPAAAAVLASSSVPRASHVVDPSVRALSRYFSIAGSSVVLGGLLWSMVRRRAQAPALALLAGGVVLVAVSSELGRIGHTAVFSAGLALGVSVMYAGFVRAG